MKDSIGSSVLTDMEIDQQKINIKATPEIKPADKDAASEYVHALRNYFISGDKTPQSLSGKIVPPKYASRMLEMSSHSSYPIYYSETSGIDNFYSFLKEQLGDTLETLSKEELDKELSEVYISCLRNHSDTHSQAFVNELMETITAEILIPYGQKKMDLESTKQSILETLQPTIKDLITFDKFTVVKLLNIQLQRYSSQHQKFLNHIKRVITGLQELLLLEGESNIDLEGGHLDFAMDFISFDKIRDIAVSAVSSHLPPARIKRLREALEILLKAKEKYLHHFTTVITTDRIASLLDVPQRIRHAHLEITEDVCQQAKVEATLQVQEFTQVIKSLRIGELLIEQKYQEKLHDYYFDHFQLSNLSENDLNHLPPLIVLENGMHLVDHSNDFLGLLDNKLFVKVLAINFLEDLFDLTLQNESQYLDLASLAIFKRNSYVFQGGIESPAEIFSAIQKGFDFTGPVLWNILSLKEDELPSQDYLKMEAAVESRMFPRIEYQLKDNHFIHQHLELGRNPLEKSDWITYEQTVTTPKGDEKRSYPFTVLHFLGMDPEIQNKFEIVNPIYQEGFLPYHEYINAKPDDLHNQIPFIWMVNEEGVLTRTAISKQLLEVCNKRQEYWEFLQSIGGIHESYLQSTIDSYRLEWETSKKDEMESLERTLTEQFKEAQNVHLQQAIYNILYKLLDGPDHVEETLSKISFREPKPGPVVLPEENKSTVETKPEVANPPPTAVSEAWVETEDCTSCKDCIDALPGVFQYDDNKQAYVHNPQGGSFAEIVKAAEKCPARCIHPGVPQNKNEADLDKWIKRAEKYN